VWHLPALYDLALRSQAVHALEHALFLGTALLFWAQVVPSLPLHRRLPYMGQAIYLGSSAMVMNVLAAVYMYSTQPLYPYYAALARAAGGLTVMEDQHVAGAAMDVPGTLLFFGAIIGLVALWLREDERAPADTGVRPSAGRWTEGTR
jgi:cytochrome c oxidase assembly factor CtaG